MRGREREQSMREDRAQRYESDWQRRVVFEADGNTMKVEIGQGCWPKRVMGRLLKSLGPWEKEYGIESAPIRPADNPYDPSTGCIWVKGQPDRMTSAEEGLRAIIGRLFPGAVFSQVAGNAAGGARRGRGGADPERMRSRQRAREDRGQPAEAAMALEEVDGATQNYGKQLAHGGSCCSEESRVLRPPTPTFRHGVGVPRVHTPVGSLPTP